MGVEVAIVELAKSGLGSRTGVRSSSFWTTMLIAAVLQRTSLKRLRLWHQNLPGYEFRLVNMVRARARAMLPSRCTHEPVPSVRRLRATAGSEQVAAGWIAGGAGNALS